jgi:hypothetical protein
MYDGGSVYASGSQSDMVAKTAPTAASPATWVEIKIYTTGTAGVSVAFDKSTSYGTGGGIYLKNGILTITDTIITSASASTNGGFLFT